MADWFNLSERIPEPGQAVLVKSEGWRIPRVLEFCIRLGCPCLIDHMSCRYFWYFERMRWTHIPADGSPGCSHCYDGGCGDSLGCGEADRRAYGGKVHKP